MANQYSASSSYSAPSCSASTLYQSFDVFINHRGPDVKNTFATRLYSKLIASQLKVFLDKPEMRQGHPITAQIEAAIEGASVHVAIFSPGYAESEWCLKELELMLKTTKRPINKATILPVFYNVEPSDLRWTEVKGPYFESLLQLEKKKTVDCKTGVEKLRYDPNAIKIWRNALCDAADISGFKLDGDEEELLKNVVKGVLKIVSKLPLFQTGLKEKLKDFEKRVWIQYQGCLTAMVVGCCGATVAKEFFNRKRSRYNRSSVSRNNRKRSLAYLIRKLLEKEKLSGTKHWAHNPLWRNSATCCKMYFRCILIGNR